MIIYFVENIFPKFIGVYRLPFVNKHITYLCNNDVKLLKNTTRLR